MLICLGALVFGGRFAGRTANADALARSFADPPATARPWVYWFWMDGNLSREGITADLEAMKRAGLGGVIIMEVNVGIPQGPVKFMSPEWRQLFKLVVTEAERLGLQITLNAGPGWTGSGGPWIKPEQSMQHLVASAVEVTGPKRFDERLPRPARRPAFFGDGGLPPELEKARNDFYRDVVVLAFPTPAGKQEISDIAEKALYVRAPYSSQPNVKPFLPAPASFPTVPRDAVIAADRILDLTKSLGADGRLVWDVPEGNWTIMRFGRTSTGANTRPAPLPGVGLECDKLDKAALDAHFEAFVGALLREIGPRKRPADAGWTMLHIDSWEMGAQNWTTAFREEFRRRRGYDPLRYLPAVAGQVVESLELSERFLWDLRLTAQDLVIENHAEHLKALGRRHGLGLSVEPYDMTPCADMSLGAVADVPMCEFWLYGFNTSYSVIEATSIAHVYDRPVVAAEAFTSTDAERWQAHPASMKALGDWAFCAGVNRIVFHRYQHQPWLNRSPGMTMGPYGVHWERTQTWWDMAPAYHVYLSRCQFMLRQGLAVADILYLSPEGAPNVFQPPVSALRGNPPDRRGYNFDACTPEALLTRVNVQAGKLVLPDGMSYRLLILPDRETMTPAVLRKLRDLVKAGATVIGPPPVKSPSLSAYPQCDQEVRRLAEELWGGVVGERPFGKGRVIWTSRPKETADVDDKNPLQHAQWIWHAQGNPAAAAPVGNRYFRCEFSLPPNQAAASARLVMTADNAFECWINGQAVGTGDNFTQTYSFDVTSLLKPGENRLAVKAENGGNSPNPAGLIGALTINFRDGSAREIVTDRQWQSAETVGRDWPADVSAAGNWGAAMKLGPLGMSPWKTPGKSAAQSEQYSDYKITAEVLGKMGVPPDFDSDAQLRYIHRRDGNTDLYFVANPEARALAANCIFRVNGKPPELWDPVTGERRHLPEVAVMDGRTTVPLRFEPHQSFFVVFRAKSAPTAKAGAKNFLALKSGLTLAGPWSVAFDPKWGGPETPVTFAQLMDWSQRPEPGIKYYSGTATYRNAFDLPPLPAGQRLYLNLGVVKNLARVRLNDQDLGVVWCAPWRVDITGAAKAKANQLVIEVVNLWPNRLIGDEQLPPDCAYDRDGSLAHWPEWLLKNQPRPSPGRYTFTTWKLFRKDSSLLPSGLLGPVELEY
jgi:hypothetical protein